MVREVSYAYSTFMERYMRTLSSSLTYCILALAYRRVLAASMRSRNAIGAVGGVPLTSIHEYCISCYPVVEAPGLY